MVVEGTRTRWREDTDSELDSKESSLGQGRGENKAVSKGRRPGQTLIWADNMSESPRGAGRKGQVLKWGLRV